MKKILITGVTGFTGQYLEAHFNSHGYEVHGTTSQKDVASVVSNVHYCELTDKNSIDYVLKKVAPNYLIHLAAISFVDHSNKNDIYCANVIGTDNLLNSIYENVPNISRVIVSSSANVYGENSCPEIPETAPFAPVNHYAISKVSTEYVVGIYSKKLPIVITRPFNYTGVGQKEHFLVAKIVSHFKEGLEFVELGNLNISRDISDVRYVSSVYGALIEASGIDGDVFNICSGVVVSLESIIESCCAITGHDIEVRKNTKFIRKNELLSLCGSNKKLHSNVVCERPIPFNETLFWMLTN